MRVTPFSRTRILAIGVVAALLGVLSSASLASADSYYQYISPPGGYFTVHPETHTTAIIGTKTNHTAGTPYKHIVNDSETSTTWGPWTRNDLGYYEVSSCVWTYNYIVRTLHDNQGTGLAYYRSDLSNGCI